MTRDERAMLITILVVGLVLIVAWVLTQIQGICIDYWQTAGTEQPPCWLPFGR